MPLNPLKGLLVYPDGSYCNGGPGGWAWVTVDGFGNLDSDSGYQEPPTTNNRMEMEAQIQAMRKLHLDYGPGQLEIVSDSLYVIMGSQDPSRKRLANLDLWTRIDNLIKLHDHVQWRHVRGHVGVKYNELADELAVKSRRGGGKND